MLHIWSDIPNHKALWVIPKPSTVYSAHDHAKSGDSYEGVSSLRQLEELFARYKKQGKKIDKLDFHTHGYGGGINIGRESLRPETLEQFEDKGFDQIFKPQARVFFHGCNVAETAYGEYFLGKFGAVFLKTGGGRVGGSTSIGVPDILFQTGKVLHFPGDTVYAHVAPGGKVRIQYPRHLDVDHIARQINIGFTEVIPLLASVCGGTARWRRPLLDEAKIHLAKAAAQLMSAKGSQGTYRELYFAHWYIDAAVKRLNKIIYSLTSAESVYLQVKKYIP